MRIDLAELAAPSHPAIVTQECNLCMDAANKAYRGAMPATNTTTDKPLEVWKQP